MECKDIVSALNPDNNEDITMSCQDKLLEIEIRNLKISSIYNTLEDILRCYEISKKIIDGEI